MSDKASSADDQTAAPLLDALSRHVLSGAARWHTPGHKGAWTDPALFAALGENVFDWDLTELAGLDNLHQPEGPIAAAEALAAELYGGDRAFFLVNGASAGLQAVLLSLTEPGPVLLPRHVHRSLVSGLILSGREPQWLQPERVGPWALPVGPGSAALRAAIEQRRPALAVFVHPTYQGYTADLAASIAACHAAGVPVLVDAAHGAHLRFHPELPPDPLALGADAAVYSFHKTLGALTGAAVLVVRKGRLDVDRIQAALTLLQTSSPSYLLLASLDAARREAALTAGARLQALLPAVRQATATLRAHGVLVADAEHLPAGFGHDPTKLTFSLHHLGRSGPEVATALAQRGIQLELAEAAYALALITPADTPARLQELTGHITEMVTAMAATGAVLQQRERQTDSVAVGAATLPSVVLTPAAAYAQPWQAVPLAQAVGRVAAAIVSVSPPGIANLVPGELIGAETVAALQQAVAGGLVVQGLRPGREPTLMVVAE